MYTDEIDALRDNAINIIRTLADLDDTVERVIASEALDYIQSVLDDIDKD